MDDERFNLTYRLTKADYEAMMANYWRLSPERRNGVRALQILVLGAGLFAAYSWMKNGAWPEAVFAVLLLSSPVVAPMINKWGYGRAFERQRLGEGDVRFTASTEEVAVKTNLGDQHFPWSSVRQVECTPAHLILWLHPYMGVLVPRSAFSSSAEADRFAEFAKQSTSGHSM